MSLATYRLAVAIVVNDACNSHIRELQNQLPQETSTMNEFIGSAYFKGRLDMITSELRTAIDKVQVSRLVMDLRTTY